MGKTIETKIKIRAFTNSKESRLKVLEKEKKILEPKGYLFKEFVEDGEFDSYAVFEVDENILKKDKRWNYLLWAIVVIAIWWFFPTDERPTPIQTIEQDMTLRYIDAKKYDPVDCRTRIVKNQYYLLCTNIGSNIGGLYYLYHKDNHKRVYALNGKAKQHTEAFNWDDIDTELPDYIEVSDITKVLGQF